MIEDSNEFEDIWSIWFAIWNVPIIYFSYHMGTIIFWQTVNINIKWTIKIFGIFIVHFLSVHYHMSMHFNFLYDLYQKVVFFFKKKYSIFFDYVFQWNEKDDWQRAIFFCSLRYVWSLSQIFLPDIAGIFTEEKFWWYKQPRYSGNQSSKLYFSIRIC